jgi:hypothetical protein
MGTTELGGAGRLQLAAKAPVLEVRTKVSVTETVDG